MSANIIPTKLSYITEIPQIRDEGYLCFFEEETHIPFSIARVYYIFDVIKNAVRGKHAHRKTKQILFCIRGSITIVLDNGYEKETVKLNKPNQGIYLDTMMWHDMVEFELETVLMVVASEKYTESDYIRDYDTFLAEAASNFTPIEDLFSHRYAFSQSKGA